MAHEETRSFSFDGKEHLFSSVDPDTKEAISDDEIIKRFKNKKLEPIGIFDSIDEMKAFAEKRSDDAGRREDDKQFDEDFD